MKSNATHPKVAQPRKERSKAAPTGSLAQWPLDRLIDHIVATHHGYLREALAKLRPLLDDVVAAHGDQDKRLQTLSQLYRGIEYQLLSHMGKEEAILFPAVRELLNHDMPGEGVPMVAGPLACMEAEHEEAEDALITARELTANYTPPPGAGKTYRKLLGELAALDADLQVHMHKENDILFPRVRAYAGDVCEAGD
jgi:regulator of cell morphogenesis and NO signaling